MVEREHPLQITVSPALASALAEGEPAVGDGSRISITVSKGEFAPSNIAEHLGGPANTVYATFQNGNMTVSFPAEGFLQQVLPNLPLQDAERLGIEHQARSDFGSRDRFMG